MTDSEVQRMKESETLILSKWQTFWHYSIVYFLLIVPVLTTISVFKYYVTHAYKGRPIEDGIQTGFIWILPAIAFYFIQKKQLKFKILNASVNKKTFHHIVAQTAKELKWNIVKSTPELIIAKSAFSWRSWGEQITIIWCSDKILFNSICDPDNTPSVTSLGRNKVNRKVFEGFLKKASFN